MYGRTINAYKILVGKPERKSHTGNQDVGEKIVSKFILGNLIWWCGLD
jgi:hypothetical protein